MVALAAICCSQSGWGKNNFSLSFQHWCYGALCILFLKFECLMVERSICCAIGLLSCTQHSRCFGHWEGLCFLMTGAYRAQKKTVESHLGSISIKHSMAWELLKNSVHIVSMHGISLSTVAHKLVSSCHTVLMQEDCVTSLAQGLRRTFYVHQFEIYSSVIRT